MWNVLYRLRKLLMEVYINSLRIAFGVMSLKWRNNKDVTFVVTIY